MSKAQPDRWCSNPARVTSFISIPPPTSAVSNQGNDNVNYSSPVCGFGWKFEFKRTFQFEASKLNPNLQERRSRIDVTFSPHLCRRVELRPLAFVVEAEFRSTSAQSLQYSCRDASITQAFSLNSYSEPFQHRGNTLFRIEVTFDTRDELSFPTSPSPDINRALSGSLDGSNLVDTKFYLYSATTSKMKMFRSPTRPRAVFANGGLLKKMSPYFLDLLSDGSFQSGIRCALRDDVPEVIERLANGRYDYDSDSDLEPEDDEYEQVSDSAKDPNPVPVEIRQNLEVPPSVPSPPPPSDIDIKTSAGADTSNESVKVLGSTQSNASLPPLPQGNIDYVKAYAISGTAYRTWKALVYYAYTNEIHFSKITPRRWKFLAVPLSPHMSTETLTQPCTCSPKSMYRLADYTGLPILQKLAKEGIREGLTERNIVGELLSRFTSQHDEIIELEVDFLVKNWNETISQEFEDALHSVVSGQKPHCYRALSFAMKRLPSMDSTVAWKALTLPPVVRQLNMSKKKKGKKGK